MENSISIRSIRQLVAPFFVVAVTVSMSVPPTRADDDDTVDHAYTEPPITASDRDHWSLKPRTPVEIPTTSIEHWQRNPVDAFIAAELERRGLTPQPEADRRTLVRRVSLDLIGLPPTPDEVTAFIADESPMAYESLVDRWLESSTGKLEVPAFDRRCRLNFAAHC